MTITTLAVTLVGMVTPKISNLLFSKVLPSGNMRLLVSITMFSICASVSAMLFQVAKSMLNVCISTKMSISVQAASMMRVMSLPVDFFKKYIAGELATKVSYINSLCNMLVSSVFSIGLTSVFSIIYIWQIFAYTPALVVPSVIITLITVLFSVVSSFWQMRIAEKEMELSSKESGMTYALISGVQKIKLSGSEKRAFARWENLYAKEAKFRYNPPLFLKINSVISLAINAVGTIVMYYAAISSEVSVADYYAFNSAYA